MALTREDILARLTTGDGPADLSGLDLSGADLSRLDLRNVNLSRADLSGADLRWAILEGADLHSTVLRRADVRWAILRGANLSHADLGRANLGWADIRGADLTGADLDATNLEHVVVSEPAPARAAPELLPGRVGARSRFGRPSAGGWPTLSAARAAWAVPRFGAAALLVAAIALLTLPFLWGWLYQRAYFGAFGIASARGVVELASATSLRIGLREVILLLLKVLLLSPLILIALVLVLGAAGIVGLALVRLAQRILADVTQPRVRTAVIIGLFVLYTAGLFIASPAVLAAARLIFVSGGPKGRGLGAVSTLAQSGPWGAQLLLVGALAATAVLLWSAWRWLAHRLAVTELPARYRLRYPALDALLAAARESRLFRRHEPLTESERLRAAVAAVAALLLLGTALSWVGRVHAYQDMCDGGSLPRIALYVNRLPGAAVDGQTVCQRLLAQTADRYYVFYPSQTTTDANRLVRRANVSEVDAASVVKAFTFPPHGAQCPTCQDGPSGNERTVVDPDEVEISGRITERSGDLLLLDVPPQTVGTVRLLPATAIASTSGERLTANDLRAGVSIRAFGRLSSDGTILEARETIVLPQPPVPVAELNVDLSTAPWVTVSGRNWLPNQEVQILVERPGSSEPAVRLASVAPAADGTFYQPIEIPADVPSGPGWTLVARSQDGSQSATGPWLQAPLPTPTATPTPYVPTVPVSTPSVSETMVPTPEEGAQPLATNTPLALPARPTIGMGVACQPDEYEPDYPRPYAKEIFVSFSGEGASQKHNFCPRGDLDLAWFRVKKGRWYRVSTRNLAPGVDTVMAVGDLDNSTRCFPAGCWNDDRGALTYESEVVFQAVEDDRAMITVDNWGSHSEDASYELAVVEFEPTPTATPTLGPTATPTVTPTITRTPLPYVDRCEPNDTCRVSGDKCRINIGLQIMGTIYPGTDEDFFETAVPLCAGATYTVTLIPPKGHDYDLEVLNPVDKSRNQCPIADMAVTGYTPGDQPEVVSWIQGATQTMVLRVFTPYPSVYGSSVAPYRLVLTTNGRCAPTATATATATPVRTPTATATATLGASPTPSATATATPTSSQTATSPPTPSETATPIAAQGLVAPRASRPLIGHGRVGRR